MLGIFGSYAAIAYFIKNYGMFQDLDEKKMVLEVIENKINYELNMKMKTYEDSIKSVLNFNNKRKESDNK